MDRVAFVIPCFNASKNIEKLLLSLKSQDDDHWYAWFIDDMSEDDTAEQIVHVSKELGVFDHVHVVKNEEKKYALKNVVETVREFAKLNDIIAVLDGDDQLCYEGTVSLLRDIYQKNEFSDQMTAWTAHKWDVNDLNISGVFPLKVDPYQYLWKTSHLKTFSAALLLGISDENFKDHNGEWFKRGYDQALYLPLLHQAKERAYIPVVCYLYNIESVSMTRRDWSEMEQLASIRFIRARGFVR